MPGLEEIVNGEGELVKMLKEKEQRKCKGKKWMGNLERF
jgi:hypothetical protein